MTGIPIMNLKGKHNKNAEGHITVMYPTLLMIVEMSQKTVVLYSIFTKEDCSTIPPHDSQPLNNISALTISVEGVAHLLQNIDPIPLTRVLYQMTG